MTGSMKTVGGIYPAGLVPLILFCSGFASANPPARSFVLTDAGPAQTIFDSVHKVIYVTVPSISQVVVISTSQHSIVARIPVPTPYSEDLSPDGTQLVVGGGNNTIGYACPYLTLIDTATLQVTKRIPIPLVDSLQEANTTLALEWTSNGTVLIAASMFDTTYSALIQWNPITNSFNPRTLPVDGMQPQGLTRSADRSKVLIFDSSTSGSNLVLYDATADGFTASTFVAGPYVAANSNGTQFAIEGVGQLAFLDASLNTTATLVINGYGAKPLFSLDGKSLFVVQNNGYTAFDTTSFQPTGQIPAFWESSAATLDGIDDIGEIYGMLNRGITFNGFPAVNELPPLFDISTISPNTGSLSSPGTLTLNGDGFGTGDVLYFGAQSVAGLAVSSSSTITATVPSSTVAGPVDVVLTNPSGGAALVPQGYSYGPTILYVQNNAGSTTGGTPVEILGYGFEFSASQVQVTIGGKSATVGQLGLFSNNIPSLQVINVMSPPGTVGPATISITTPVGTTVLTNGFYYYSFSSSVGPTATGQMVFDHGRQVLYVTDDNANQVDVISPASNKINGTLPTGSGPVGISLTPDDSTLVVANWNSQSVSLINIVAGTQQQIVLNPSGNGPGSLHPTSVAASNNGKAYVGATDISGLDNGQLFELDLMSGQMTVVSNTGLYLTSDIELHPFLGGSKIWIGSGDRGGSSGSGAVIWDSATGTFMRQSAGLFPESDIVDNGIVTAEGSGFYDPEGQLFSAASPLDLLKYPYITYGVRLHPGGGLFFRPYTTGSTSLSAIGVFDVNTGAMLREIAVPGNPGSTFDTMAVDDTGNRVFLSTDSGIITVSLAPLPISIGTLNPAQGLTIGGDQIVITGSNFQDGAVVSFGGTAATTTWVDQNTLLVVTPTEALGQVGVSVANPDGSSYYLPAAFTYVSSIPGIASTNPTSAIPGNGLALTVYGSNFVLGSTIRWNGVAQTTTFVDTSTLQTVVSATTIGSNLGSSNITVFNPDAAISNSFALPLSYPPAQLVCGSGSYDFGAQLINTSSQQLTTYLGNPNTWPASPTVSATGDFSQTNNCPVTMQPQTQCTILVIFTPSQDGVRNGNLTCSSPGSTPQVVELSGRGIPAGPALTTTPYSVDFGQAFMGGELLAQSQVNIYSVGPNNANISAVSVSGDYQVTQNTCQGTLTVGSSCYVFLTFAPTVPGTRTGSLTVASNATDTPLGVPLTAVALQPFVLSPNLVTFSPQLIGTSSTQQVSVQNANRATISALTSINTPPGFTATSNCGENIYPGTSCTINVIFSPGLTGSNNGTMVMSEEINGLQQMVNYQLVGSGMDFELSVAQGGSNTTTVNAGQTANYALSLTDSGYSGTVSVTCNGTPTLSTCTVNPTSVTISGNTPQPISISVQTTAPSARIAETKNRPTSTFWIVSKCGTSFFAVTLLIYVRRRPGFARPAHFIMLSICCMTLLSCGSSGSGGGGGGGGGAGSPGTPQGTYSLTITATSNGATRTMALTLNVQ